MFTDWTMTDPRYFYMRGAIWGFVLCLAITKIVIPKIKYWIRNRRLRLIKPTILRETHEVGCTCSYCKEGSVGIVLPESKAWNSWRSIRWYRNGRLNVIRWTLFKIEYR